MLLLTCLSVANLNHLSRSFLQSGRGGGRDNSWKPTQRVCNVHTERIVFGGPIYIALDYIKNLDFSPEEINYSRTISSWRPEWFYEQEYRCFSDLPFLQKKSPLSNMGKTQNYFSREISDSYINQSGWITDWR